MQLNCILRKMYCIHIRARGEGYTVQSTPLPEVVSVPVGNPKVTPKCKRLFLTVYPESSLDADIISAPRSHTWWAASMASVARNSRHRFLVDVDRRIRGRMINQCCPGTLNDVKIHK